MHTPWGPAQHVNTLAAGVALVTTASHGGIHLDAGRNAEVHPAWRHADGWYEEDCDWAIVALTFQNLFNVEQLADARVLAGKYHADAYAKVFGGGGSAIDLDALSDAVNEALAAQPAEAEGTTAEELAALMERAKKLLTMAERGATQGERDAFADKAAALMAKYGITAAMLAHGGKTSTQVSDWIAEVSGPLCYDKVSLLAAMVKVYGGQIIYTDKNPQHSTLRVYAMPADMERIQVLWPSLLTQMTTEMGWATANKPAGVRADVFGRSFIHGFVGVVMKRLEAAERYAERQAQEERNASGTGGTSVALVLAGQKRQVELAFKKAHPSRTTSRRKVTSSHAGISAGQLAGQRADIGQSRVGA